MLTLAFEQHQPRCRGHEQRLQLRFQISSADIVNFNLMPDLKRLTFDIVIQHLRIEGKDFIRKDGQTKPSSKLYIELSLGQGKQPG